MRALLEYTLNRALSFTRGGPAVPGGPAAPCCRVSRRNRLVVTPMIRIKFRTVTIAKTFIMHFKDTEIWVVKLLAVAAITLVGGDEVDGW